MRKMPSSPTSMSWPTTVASRVAAWVEGGAELSSVEDKQAGVGVFGPTVDEGLTSRLVVPVDHGLGRGGVVVPAASWRGTQFGGQFGVGHLEHVPGWPSG